MEHIFSRRVIGEGELQDAPLRLALHDGIDYLERWFEAGTVVIIVEKVSVQVKGGDIEEKTVSQKVKIEPSSYT